MKNKKTYLKKILSHANVIKNSATLHTYYHNDFKIFNNFEHLLNESENRYGKTKTNQFLNLFDSIYRAILLEFRNDSIFLSPSMLSTLIYFEWKSNSLLFIDKTIESLYLYGINKHSYIIFPLVKFGISKSGIKMFFSKKLSLSLNLKESIFFPQTNDHNKTILSISNYIQQSENKKPNLDLKLIAHYLKSRPLEWFNKNPIAILKIKSTFSSYYENEFIISKILEKEIAKLIILNISQKKKYLAKTNSDISTLNVNNFSTKDIKHYLYLYKQKDKTIPVAIPLHEGRGFVSELINTNLDIFLHKGSPSANTLEIFNFIDLVYNIILSKKIKGEEFNFYMRIISSLEFLRRSISTRIGIDKWIYFGSALEILLSEGVKGVITETIKINGAFLIKTKQESLYKKIETIYDNRSKAIHQGTETEDSIKDFYSTYTEIFHGLIKLIKKKKLDLKLKRPLNDFIKKSIVNGKLTKWEKKKISDRIQ
ncbi:hypothetical protein EHQ24_00110 [Leptospira noumeaensis]|uniref:Uncharacterized protein n=1 Tax=Leptospira noumeaensis TaxID=2484964 RepID=A0A4R9IJA4_9LEPT|nr:HEPN domain-containing protein [Leptospira noumeaensis]TGK89242.1 hypothetical protein EHQ24_00110 [Leptospira noumeaensis]